VDRWKDTKSFFLWVDKEKQKAKEELEDTRTKTNGLIEYDDRETMMHLIDLVHTYELDIKYLKKHISKNVLEYLNQTSNKMNLLCIDTFISTIEDITYFKQSKMSIDGSAFREEIEILKKKADTLQFFSNGPIEIKLPKLPHVCIYEMVDVLKKRGVDMESIKLLNSYFDNRMRLPSRSNSVDDEYLKIKDGSNFISDALKSGLYTGNKAIIETIAVELMDYYIPDIGISYHRKLSPKKT